MSQASSIRATSPEFHVSRAGALDWARYTLIFAALFPVGLWAVWPLLGIDEQPIAPGLWLLVVVSAISNVFILAFHYTTPPHPKFVMVPWRRFWLRVHIVSGSLEYVAGMLVLLLPGRGWPGVLMAVIALGFHVPSSFAQNRIVAGSRAIMVPMYIAGIAMHGFCAAMLLRHPASVFWAVNTFLLFNTYAWVRLYGFLFQQFDLFATSRYTVMVMAAGVTTMTPVLGPIWPLQLCLFLGLYIVLYRRFFARDPATFLNFVREHSRWTGISEEAAALWSAHSRSPDQRNKARAVFDVLDREKTGRLSLDHLRLAAAWALPPEAIDSFSKQFGKDGIDFETFFERFWSQAGVRHQASLIASIHSPNSVRDKARFVFDLLDLDQDGFLTAFEMQLLLLEWNLPPKETDQYFAACDKNGDGRIDFEEFYSEMRPVWRYLYYQVLSRQAASAHLLSAAPPRAKDDDQAVGQMAARLKRDLVGKIPFLQDAPPALLAELVEAFHPETFEAGTAIIREWAVGDRFYVLAEGQAEVTRCGEYLSTLGPGASFGESALLLDTRRNASVTATQACTVYAISRSSFRALVGKYGAMRERLETMATANSRIRVRDSLMQLLRSLEALPTDEVPPLADLLCERVKELRFAEGEHLMQQGEAGTSLLILQSGQAVIRRDGVELRRMGPGECLGELALLSGAPRRATATALEPTSVLSLAKVDFDIVMERSIAFQRSLEALRRQRT